MKLMKFVILSVGILSVSCTPIERSDLSYSHDKRESDGTADYFLKGLAGLMVKLGRTKPQDILAKMLTGTKANLEGAALGNVVDIKSKMFALLETYQEVITFTLAQMKSKVSLSKLHGLADATARNILGLAEEAQVRIRKDAEKTGLDKGKIDFMEKELGNFVKTVTDSLSKAKSVFEQEFKHNIEPEKKNKKKFSLEIPPDQPQV
ncbi:hypothetical protein K7432_011339 [Basidiobolus ranarum]|uniref:Lipoprotein n=1 Tax=Basidiobolus ranarum TaxID=34480 RepID=A0ABR2VU13_9FUNG